MTLYETIFKRRSVRKYDKTPLPAEVLSGIKNHIDQTAPLDGCGAKFEIVCGSCVNDDKAPHYILAFCGADIKQYINVGYMLQKTDLYLQSMGLGSVWLGMAKPKKDKENYCIMLAFGKTDAPYREISEFKRLPLGEISNADNAVANAARLAPSAVNSQPWKLNFSEGKVKIDYYGRGLLKALLRKKKSPIDIGIITRHAELALLQEGKTIKSIIPDGNDKNFSAEIQYE